ncbi:acyl-CoA N-acyltransferase [Fomitopsis betulina]|nr:acyl-CoA N-acyltransferase [Fomitopsis betulina]
MSPAFRRFTRACRTRSNIDKANEAASSDLASFLDQAGLFESRYNISFEVVLASVLSEGLRREIWATLENNMKELYTQSSFGWNPEKKQAELFHESSRFLLARKLPEPGSSSESAPSTVAYSMFRFEREEKQDVIYCYELQVHQDLRRAGLGKHLMRHLVSISKGWKMEKIMLTVFKANHVACNFYKAIGFELDPTSPEYYDDDEDTEDYDYEILSTPTP